VSTTYAGTNQSITVNCTAAWLNYTPTVTAQTGTITTLSVATGYYYTIGKTVFANIYINITDRGTGAGYMKFTLPLPTRPSSNGFPKFLGTGRENAINGSAIQVFTHPLAGTFDANVAQACFYNDTTIIANGYQSAFSLMYETA